MQDKVHGTPFGGFKQIVNLLKTIKHFDLLVNVDNLLIGVYGRVVAKGTRDCTVVLSIAAESSKLHEEEDSKKGMLLDGSFDGREVLDLFLRLVIEV